MPSQDEFKNKARAQARSVLAKSKTFHALPKNEQMALYSDVVDAELNNLTGKSEQLATAQSTHADEVASNLDATSEGLGDLMDAVDFPTFVGDLLTAVFDANLDVTIKQMNTYRELMQAATGEISKFVKNVDDAESFAYLAENDSDNFSIGFPEEGEGGALKLLDKEGEEVDPSDSEIRAKIMDAKIAMAKEHRAMLRETLLMGITRLVVEKGTIKASVAFNINTKTKTKVGDQRTDTEKRRGVKHTRTSSPWFWPVRTRYLQEPRKPGEAPSPSVRPKPNQRRKWPHSLWVR